MDKDFRKDKDVVLAAVNDYGWALRFAHEDLRKDKDVVLAAVKNDAEKCYQESEVIYARSLFYFRHYITRNFWDL